MIVVDWDMGPLVEYWRASARGGGVVSQLAAAAAAGGVGVCSIGGVLRGNSLFSADGAAVGMVWCHGGCVVGPLWYLLSRVVCDLLVGRKASSPSAPLPPVCELCLGVVCSPLYSWCGLSRIKWLAVFWYVCFGGRQIRLPLMMISLI